jgi:hypothetical protein
VPWHWLIDQVDQQGWVQNSELGYHPSHHHRVGLLSLELFVHAMVVFVPANTIILVTIGTKHKQLGHASTWPLPFWALKVVSFFCGETRQKLYVLLTEEIQHLFAFFCGIIWHPILRTKSDICFGD